MSALQSFLERLRRDPRLQIRVHEATTAAVVSLIAQELGYSVSGSELLMSCGKSFRGIRLLRIEHPGEYPHRY